MDGLAINVSLLVVLILAKCNSILHSLILQKQRYMSSSVSPKRLLTRDTKIYCSDCSLGKNEQILKMQGMQGKDISNPVQCWVPKVFHVLITMAVTF